MSIAAAHPQTLAAALPTAFGDVAVSNSYDLLLKVLGVVVIVAGLGIAYASRKGQISKNIGVVAIVILGLFLAAIGAGIYSGGNNKVGQALAAFLGF